MCTMIAQQVNISGSGKAGEGWFRLDTASVSYDHPFDMPLEYSLNLDFTKQAGNPGGAWRWNWMQPRRGSWWK